MVLCCHIRRLFLFYTYFMINVQEITSRLKALGYSQYDANYMYAQYLSIGEIETLERFIKDLEKENSGDSENV